MVRCLVENLFAYQCMHPLQNLGNILTFHIGLLTFADLKKFPALALAIDVGRRGGTLPSVLNAADEIAVDAFLNKKIRFSAIYKIVEKIVQRHKINKNPTLKQVFAADHWAREEAKRFITR